MSSTTPDPSPRTLPRNPDLRHLKDQARDLVRSGQAQKLSQAQRQVARSYGYPSWLSLKAHVESLQEVGQLKAAIDRNDFDAVRSMMTRNPALHRAPLGYGKNGPLTWTAECRVPPGPPTAERLAIARWMLENGSDVHQGGDGPLMRASLNDHRIPMMELLLEFGADVSALWGGSYPIVLGPCETLAPRSLQWLLEHGATLSIDAQYGSPMEMLIGTYSREPSGKHACLELLARAGYHLPDTPTTALHRGRIDLLQEHLQRDARLLGRRFTGREIFPSLPGKDDWRGMHVTPVEGTTLLHLALEYDELEIAEWLLERGADVNARATVDAEGFGGHTPLFHAVVYLGRSDGAKARLLLEHGADPKIRTTLRKQLVDMGDPEKETMREFHNVTAAEYARQFQEPAWVDEEALQALTGSGAD